MGMIAVGEVESISRDVSTRNTTQFLRSLGVEVKLPVNCPSLSTGKSMRLAPGNQMVLLSKQAVSKSRYPATAFDPGR